MLYHAIVRVEVEGEVERETLIAYLGQAVQLNLDTENHGTPDGGEVVAIEIDWENVRVASEPIP